MIPKTNCHPILIYSVFGLGKTTLVADLAQQILPEGTKMRLVTAEHTNSIADRIDTGLIEVWKINNRDYPFETLRFAADGFWPENPADPKSKLVAPTYDTWDDYPIRVFEGLATLSHYLAGSTVIGALSNRIGQGEKIGPTDSGELVRIQDNQTGVGSPSRSNFGFIQREMVSIVQRSQKYPGIVIWTSHDDEVKEKKAGIATGKTIIGPEVYGGALTTSIGREFADVWHIVGIDQEIVDDSGSRNITERRLYVKAHNVNGASGLAKNSGPKSRQAVIPDYFMMTDEQGNPRMDIAERLISGPKNIWGKEKK